jgi:hypothetical protein
LLPAHRSKFSKNCFTQPQLLAILCLIRYADRAFREAEVRLVEYAELRAPLGCNTCPIIPVSMRVNDLEPGFTWCDWLKWTTGIDVDWRLIVGQEARSGLTRDSAPCARWWTRPIGRMLADAEFDSACHH